MGTEDQPRDDHGRWSSSGSMGRQPVQSHDNQPSVHTRLSAAARDRIVRMKGIDQRRYGVPMDTQGSRLRPDTGAKTDFGKPMASQTSTPGRFKFQTK